MNAETQDSNAPDQVDRRAPAAPLLAEVLARLKPLKEDFPVIDDPPTEPEDFL